MSRAGSSGPLDRFSAPVRAWFETSFAAPTDAQAAGLAGDRRRRPHPAPRADRVGQDARRVPLGDRPARRPRPSPTKDQRCRVLYISPLRALAVDVEKNLRAPLAGIALAAERLGVPFARADRRACARATRPARSASTRPQPARHPHHHARVALPDAHVAGARDAARRRDGDRRRDPRARADQARRAPRCSRSNGSKRSPTQPPQRIGLSATQRPLDEIARFLGGSDDERRPAGHDRRRGIAQGARRRGDRPGRRHDRARRALAASGADGAMHSGSIDPESRRAASGRTCIRASLELIRAHRTTIVFCNARRTAERLAAHLNELAGEELVRAHHGSLSREQRLAGRVRAQGRAAARRSSRRAASSSASTWARSTSSCSSSRRARSRAACSASAAPATRSASRARGKIFPKYRGDLLEAAVVVQRMRDGLVEEMRYPRNPLDVLAQQIVAAVARRRVGRRRRCYALVRRCANFAELSDDAFRETLDMLAGRYPSDRFAGLRPRVVWDRVAGPGARARGRAARRGHERRHDPRPRPVRRVPPRRRARRRARRGDGLREPRRRDASCSARPRGASRRSPSTASSSRPRRASRRKTPFWQGDKPGPAARARPRARRARPRAARRSTGRRPRPRCAPSGLDARAAANLRALPRRAGRGHRRGPRRPHDRDRALPRRDRRLARLHPHAVRRARARAVGARDRGAARARLDLPVQVLWSDDGIILRLPEVARRRRRSTLLLLDPDELDELVVDAVAEHVAVRVALPRERGPRAAAPPPPAGRAHAAVAAAPARGRPARGRVRLPDVPDAARDDARVPARRVRPSRAARGAQRHPIAQACASCPVETRARVAVRAEPAVRLDRRLHVRGRRAARRAPGRRARARPRPAPRPPRRRGAARAARPGGARRRSSSSCSGSCPTRQRAPRRRPPRPARRPRSARRRRGRARGASPIRSRGSTTLLARAARDRRSARGFAAAEDAARLRDALGVAIPAGLPAAFTDPVARPLDDLVARYARTHVPFATDDVVARLGVTAERARDALGAARSRRPRRARRVPARRRRARVVRRGRAARRCAGGRSPRCATRSSRSTRRRSRASCPRGRASAAAGAALDALVEALEQLQGVAIPASVLERDVLPGARRRLPARACSTSCARRASSCGSARARSAPTTVASACSSATGSGCSRRRSIDDAARPRPVHDAIRDAARAGRRVVLARPRRGRGHRRRRGRARRAVGSRVGGRGHERHVRSAARAAARVGAALAQRAAPASRPPDAPRPAGGRGPLVARRAAARTRAVADRDRARRSRSSCSNATASSRAKRVRAEGAPGGFAGVYPVLRALEESGRARRGWFVAGLGAAQFALPGRGRPAPRAPHDRRPTSRHASSCSPRPIPRSRTAPRSAGPSSAGAAGRRARPGAHVVLVDGECVGVRRARRTGARSRSRDRRRSDDPTCGPTRSSKRTRKVGSAGSRSSASTTSPRARRRTPPRCAPPGFADGYKGLTLRKPDR